MSKIIPDDLKTVIGNVDNESLQLPDFRCDDERGDEDEYREVV